MPKSGINSSETSRICFIMLYECQSKLTGLYITKTRLLTCRFPKQLPIQQFLPNCWNLHYRLQAPWSSEPYLADLHALGDSATHIQIINLFQRQGSQERSLSTEIKQLWTEWHRNQRSIPGRNKRFFCSPYHPEWHWGPFSLLSIGNWGALSLVVQWSGFEGLKVTTHHQMPGLGMGSVISLCHISSRCDGSLSTGTTIFYFKSKICVSCLLITFKIPASFYLRMSRYDYHHTNKYDFNNDNKLMSIRFTLSMCLAQQIHMKQPSLLCLDSITFVCFSEHTK